MTAMWTFIVIYAIVVVILAVWAIWWCATGRARRFKQRMEYKEKYLEYKAKYDAEHGIDPMGKEELDDYIKEHDLDRTWRA